MKSKKQNKKRNNKSNNINRKKYRKKRTKISYQRCLKWIWFYCYSFVPRIYCTQRTIPTKYLSCCYLAERPTLLQMDNWFDSRGKHIKRYVCQRFLWEYKTHDSVNESTDNTYTAYSIGNFSLIILFCLWCRSDCGVLVVWVWVCMREREGGRGFLCMPLLV